MRGRITCSVYSIDLFSAGDIVRHRFSCLGIKAQREIRMEGQSGRTLALIATYIGGFTILAMLCMITAGVIFLPRIYEWIVQAIHQVRP